jgi:hypothetical protein
MQFRNPTLLRRRTLGFVTNQACAGLLFANCALT